MPDLDFANDAAFVADIDGFEQTDSYLMRWRGTFTADSEGFYAFSTTSDDGSMLYVDGEIIVDNDGLHGAQTREGAITLTQGDHAIVITFFENGGGAQLRVTVTPPGGEEQVSRSSPHFLRHLYIKPFFHQDRLGTNIGKALKKEGDHLMRAGPLCPHAIEPVRVRRRSGDGGRFG